MQDHKDNSIDESQWPSVDLAYEFVAPSYDWIQRRYESVERRIQTFLAFTATLTLGVPALMIAVEKSADFVSVWFIGAMVTAVLILALGIAAIIISNTSGLLFLNPANLYRNWLGLGDTEFKTSAIYWAGQHFNTSASTIYKMGWILTTMLVLFSVEIVFLLIWVITSLA